jgi:hypothetical protein
MVQEGVKAQQREKVRGEEEDREGGTAQESDPSPRTVVQTSSQDDTSLRDDTESAATRISSHLLSLFPSLALSKSCLSHTSALRVKIARNGGSNNDSSKASRRTTHSLLMVDPYGSLAIQETHLLLRPSI